MDQQKIGAFMKALRKEKQLTQEQFAEKFNVSSRTVSRWENGNNMPDLDIIIQISDFYGIEIRELLDGERKNGNMNKELEENIIKAADYTNTGALIHTKKQKRCYLSEQSHCLSQQLSAPHFSLRYLY